MHNLEVHYLSNRSGALHFAVLSDWPDSQSEQTTADLELLDHCARTDRRAEPAPSDGGSCPVLPAASPPALQCLGRLLDGLGAEARQAARNSTRCCRGDKDTTFFAPSSDLPDDIQHVLTLDSDTRMTRDAVTRLVGKMRHPLKPPRSSSGRPGTRSRAMPFCSRA